MTDTFGPLPPDAISRCEAEIGCSLPESYRRFLLDYNGGRPEPAHFPVTWKGQPFATRFPYDSVHFLFGFVEGGPGDIIRNFQDYRERIPEGMIPVGNDPGGNLLLLGCTEPNIGKVFLWVQDEEADEGEKPDYRNVGFIADSFDDFLGVLYDK